MYFNQHHNIKKIIHPHSVFEQIKLIHFASSVQYGYVKSHRVRAKTKIYAKYLVKRESEFFQVAYFFRNLTHSRDSCYNKKQLCAVLNIKYAHIECKLDHVIVT